MSCMSFTMKNKSEETEGKGSMVKKDTSTRREYIETTKTVTENVTPTGKEVFHSKRDTVSESNEQFYHPKA